MKNVILCTCAIMLTTVFFGQEKRKEVGINLHSSNEFGIFYRSGTDTSLWRFNLLSSNVGTTSYESEFQERGIGFSIGKEFRNKIAKKFEFRHGFDLGLNYNNTTSQSESEYLFNNGNDFNDYTYERKTNSYIAFVNAVIGFNFLINKKIIIGAEILPKISYGISDSKYNNLDTNEEGTGEAIGNSSSSSFNFNLDSNSARLSLAYRL